jgi:hypothetical protein
MFIVHPDYPDRSEYKLFVDIGSLAASPHFCGAPKKEYIRNVTSLSLHLDFTKTGYHPEKI